MGGNLGAAVPGRGWHIARPGTVLVAGTFTVLMLAASAAVTASAGELKLSDLGQAALWLSFGLVGVVAASASRSPGQSRVVPVSPWPA